MQSRLVDLGAIRQAVPHRVQRSRDPITWGRIFQQPNPGARGLPHRTIRHAGHFPQEDQSLRLVEIIDGTALN